MEIGGKALAFTNAVPLSPARVAATHPVAGSISTVAAQAQAATSSGMHQAKSLRHSAAAVPAGAVGASLVMSATRRWRRRNQRRRAMSRGKPTEVALAGGRATAGSPRAVARRASPVETATFEAGAKLLQDALKATEKGSATDFQYESLEQNRQSFVSQEAALQGEEDVNAVDEDGLPLVYSVERINQYWDTQDGAVVDRWSRFLGISTPFVTRFVFSLLNGRLWEDEEDLARLAVDNLTELGPTFVKLGQVLSIRPDVLPEKTMKELSRLQDNIETFPTQEARDLVEAELGKPIDEVFSSFSEEPVAAASLAQVYRAVLRETGEEVAVKVQRPGALQTVSKDLYVLRRLADVVQPLIKRFTADETDYIALTETFAEGLYTELDFRNEAFNAIRMDELMTETLSPDVREQLIIPTPLLDYTTRRIMVSRWVNGSKLSDLPPEEIRRLIAIGQEVFLTQLLTAGFFHGDPHPGNLLCITEGPDAGKLCLLDFGLVARVPEDARDIIVSSVVHLGTQNFEALIDDFIKLGFLSDDVDRAFLIPLLNKILRPYLRGGGAQSLKGLNFQSLSQDLLKVNLEVRFSIPPYVSLLARSVATLEGLALKGDKEYQIVAQAYPFVVRKLLQNDNRLSFAALRELLYDPETQRMKPQRLASMLQAGLGVIADDRAGFIDFDALPKEGAPLEKVLEFLLSEKASKLRPLLNAELAYGLDLAFRRASRELRTTVSEAVQPRVPLLGVRLPLPPPPPPPVPVLLSPPEGGDSQSSSPPRVRVVPLDRVLDAALPPLSRGEDVDYRTFSEAFDAALLEPDSLDNDPMAADDLFGPAARLRQLVAAAVAVASGDSESAVAETAKALRQVLSVSESRQVLLEEVVASIARDLVDTWRARLEAKIA
eukprot:CAMPEP_0178400598 /NCGR_PEP_ID=MMETSP0689_2-20121128/15872_1 /TAXON_ID=160604 /ORGANISM="Amphidinium massartii, Strain CS-259" /LENGTH=889 /DNA_ID=CAMNT_0020021399 /DNA_START=21 /DNA_END=2690 /DNA_ORIENTATION=+